MSNLIFTKHIIQGPLAGYSCAPFRKLATTWGQPDFCCSEMLSAQSIYSGAVQRKRYCYKDPNEGPLCVQLAGDQPNVLSYAAQQVMQWGANLIDLNCGCPQPKIRKKNYGSRLLANAKRIEQLIFAIKQAVTIPVLIKIRVDAESSDQYNLAVAQAAMDAGADAITVHGRHWSQNYETPVNYSDIASIKNQITIPVIGNGDIHDTQSARLMFDQTGCDAIMISRASVGQPWIFAQIHAELQGNCYHTPNLATIGQMLLRHVTGLIDLEGETIALLQARKLAKYYSRQRFNDQEFIKKAQQVNHYEQLVQLVQYYFI